MSSTLTACWMVMSFYVLYVLFSHGLIRRGFDAPSCPLCPHYVLYVLCLYAAYFLGRGHNRDLCPIPAKT